ncbi:MAG: hypothetical protein ACRCSK_00320 [Fusobacteriaceae bacterium]
MYSQGETFGYEIGGNEFELHVIENVSYGGEEYILAEDFDGKIHVFLFDEDSEDVERVNDRADAQEIIKYWKDEYLVPVDMKYDDDGYYDLDDDDIKYSESDSYFDDDDYIEEDEEY